MTQPSLANARCSRCGRTYDQVPGEWNVVYRHGVLEGYLCPEDQTAEENSEAAVKDAFGRPTTHDVSPGDPHYRDAMAEHIVNTAEDVLTDHMRMIVALGDDAEPVPLDPHALADQTLERLAPAFVPVDREEERERGARLIVEMLQEG